MFVDENDTILLLSNLLRSNKEKFNLTNKTVHSILLKFILKELKSLGKEEDDESENPMNDPFSLGEFLELLIMTYGLEFHETMGVIEMVKLNIAHSMIDPDNGSNLSSKDSLNLN